MPLIQGGKDARIAYVQCIAKSDNAPCLLGQIVFEHIDYVVDCRNQKVIPNPESEPGLMTFEMY